MTLALFRCGTCGHETSYPDAHPRCAGRWFDVVRAGVCATPACLVHVDESPGGLPTKNIIRADLTTFLITEVDGRAQASLIPMHPDDTPEERERQARHNVEAWERMNEERTR